MYTLEICVDNIVSAKNAALAGANRLELCSELSVGGLTPSVGLFKTVQKIVNIPIHVLIRPRSGHFEYDEEEINVMEEDIQNFINLGVDGIVLGALKGSEIDMMLCRRLIGLCENVPVTFHRAFDLCTDHTKALEDAISLKCSRILTSGFSPSAYNGMSEIQELVKKAMSRIIIMPGCGITVNNLAEIKEVTNAKEFHASASELVGVSCEHPVVKGTTSHLVTSETIVRSMKKCLV
ncbi:copper homeostasis protein cutC homolog [Uloborus diversus]|uniref:copper homeostasis protein cutC homolog n=1 Tax=Uloborus diversus TaxID=327109 RepID=UPI0024090F92|nr:copper homeostasis protein cutC homolog [Uloborus diversus]